MASTINSTVNGVSVSSDSTGALNIKVGGVTAIEIGAGASVIIGNLAISASLTLTTLNATSASITTLTGTSATITKILDGAGNVRDIPSAGAAKTSAYTLSVSDVGEYVTIGSGGGIVVPDGIFSAGNAISVVNDTTGDAAISLTITTAYLAGTDADKAVLTLATRGIATVLFLSNSACIVSGNVS